MKYGYVCVAGTFDGLHRGHEALLLRAFEVGPRVLIGLTSDSYVKQYKQTVPSSYIKRHKELMQWVNAHGYIDRTVIISIDDPFEPAASSTNLDAIVVSEQSRLRGEEINRMRIRRGLSALALSLVPMVYAADHTPISTTRVREGVIDREGRFTMPDWLRKDLTMPLGMVLAGEKIEESILTHARDTVISVGDLTTKTLLEVGVTPRLMIIDNKVNRMEFRELQPLIAKLHIDTKKAVSGPGFISKEALDEIRIVLKSRGRVVPFVLEIDGEEDLLALPAIIEAPLGSVVYYGQSDVGMVEVIVTKKKKKEAIALLEKFIHNTI